MRDEENPPLPVSKIAAVKPENRSPISIRRSILEFLMRQLSTYTSPSGVRCNFTLVIV